MGYGKNRLLRKSRRRSVEVGIFVGIRGRAAAEKAQRLGRRDLMPGTGRDQNAIPGPDGTFFPVEFHAAGAFEDEVEFLAELVVMAIRCGTDRKTCLRQTLVPHRGVRLVENTANRRAVLGRKFLLIPEVLDNHRPDFMRFFEGCTALITGASAGLGAEFARQLAPHAQSLILLARREDRLEELRNELEGAHQRLKVYTYPIDLARESEIDAFVEWLSKEEIVVDFLVNNAGLGDHGRFEASDWNRVRTMLEVNIAALTKLTYLLLPSMRQSGRSAILNVSSIASFIPLPNSAVYAATKAYVTSFSEALRLELRGSCISVTALCPGPVPTEFFDVASRPGSELTPEMEAPGWFIVEQEQVVREALHAVAHDRARVVPGLLVGLAMAAATLLPLFLLRQILHARMESQG